MRTRRMENGISVHAIAGTYVVLLGINVDERNVNGLLGFAIHREDHTEKEQYWLRGFRTFKETFPDPPPASLVSTQEHPVQAFLWGDYTAKPNHSYTYTVVPVYGRPKNLRYAPGVRVTVTTESESDGAHLIYFNRGAAGSQAYARKFGNRAPDEVPGRKAFIWLSRGLEEALLNFIGLARGPECGLRAAVYEFTYLPVLKAFADAARGGADVKIVYDRRTKGPHKESEKAIRKAKIAKLMIKRRQNPSYISHNKFIVLLKNGKPQQVWTGSANFTEGGIFGQSNVGHVVRDESVAQRYLDYWERLAHDPPAKDLRAMNVEDFPEPTAFPHANSMLTIFSPRPTLKVLEWYANLMDDARQMVALTAAFGVNRLLASVFEEEKDYLRYILLERRGKTFEMLKRDKDNRIALGATLGGKAIGDSALQRWLAERLTGLNTFVKYVHTKYLLIDPLSNNPTTISGSANFSDASTKNNDENMLLIHGDTRVADIYIGEFMRLFNHFYFRDVANRLSHPELVETAYLDPGDSWARAYFETASVKEKERLSFA